MENRTLLSKTEINCRLKLLQNLNDFTVFRMWPRLRTRTSLLNVFRVCQCCIRFPSPSSLSYTQDKGDWCRYVFNLLIVIDGSVCLLGFTSKRMTIVNWDFVCCQNVMLQFVVTAESDIIIYIRLYSSKKSSNAHTFIEYLGIVVRFILI